MYHGTEPNRSLARIEQRIEDLCRRVDPQLVADRHPIVREHLVPITFQAFASTDQWKNRETNVLSTIPNQGRSTYASQQVPGSEALAASVDGANLLPIQEKGSFGLRKGAFYGQSLLPPVSSPISADKSPGQTLLERLEVSVEPGALQALSTGEADQMLATFRLMTFHFPIFSFPEGASCIDCIDQKPFVTLAILVATSSGNERLQAACDITFRNVLARRVIVEGNRNLELLQGLLIYLSWHHHYLRHETQQIYQYLQLAIGMVVDLGLDKIILTERPLSNSSHSGIKAWRTSAVEGAAEEARALLGCYTLSCGLAILGFDKPQNLAYTMHLRRCAEHLAEHGVHDTDRDWLPMVELLHIAEQIQGLWRTNVEAETVPSQSRVHMRDVEQQLQIWKDHCPIGTRDHTRLCLTFHFIQIYLYEKALSETRSMQSEVVQQAEDALTPIPRVPMLLLSTLHATQAFLDEILVKPASLLRNMNIVEWTQLITAAIILARLAQLGPEQTRETGVDHMQIKMQVDTYTWTLCKCMSALGFGNVQHDASGLFSWFIAIAQGIKLWVAGPEASSRTEDSKVKTAAYRTNHSATTALEAVKNLALHVESSDEKSDPNEPPTDD